MALTPDEIYRDFVTNGVPSSGVYEPKKSEIRELLNSYETYFDAFISAGGLVWYNRTTLYSSLNYPANTMAWVIGDAITTRNGIYMKSGSSGSGSWTRVGDLPYSFIIASDVGSGTANAIQATTSIPVSSSALIWTNVFRVNTGSPVTISFNSLSPLTVKTNSGENVSVGGLKAGQILLGIADISNGIFRLFSDEAIASLIYAARDQAANSATAAASSAVDSQTSADLSAYYASIASVVANVPYYATFDGMSSITLPSGMTSFYVAGRSAVGDGGEGLVVVSDTDPGQPAAISGRSGPSGTGKYLYYSVDGDLPIAVCGVKLNQPSLDQTAAFDLAMQTGRSLVIPSGSSIRTGVIQFYANGQRIKGQSRSGGSINYSKLICNALSVDWIRVYDPTWDITGSVTLTVAPTAATSGILTTAFSGATGSYWFKFANNPAQAVTLTNGSTAVFWSDAVTDASTAVTYIKRGSYWSDVGLETLYLDCSKQTAGYAVVEKSTLRGRFTDVFFNSPNRVFLGQDLNSSSYFRLKPEGTRGAENFRIQDRYDGSASDALRFEEINCSGTDDNLETIGFRFDGNVAGVYMSQIFGQKCRDLLYGTNSSLSGATNLIPSDFRIQGIGGDYLTRSFVYGSFSNLKIIQGHFVNNRGTSAASDAGIGIYQGTNSRNWDISQVRIVGNDKQGVIIAGQGFRISNCEISRNSAAGTNSYDGIEIRSTATQVHIQDGNKIGYHYDDGTEYSGRQRYGISIASGIDPENVLISSGNDLRKNQTAAINSPWLCTFLGGWPIPLDGLAPLPNLCDNGLFSINQTSVADGSKAGNSKIRDRWFAGASGLTLTTNSDGSITISSGSSINQTIVNANLASKSVWVAIDAATATTHNLTITVGSQSSTVSLRASRTDRPRQWRWVKLDLTSGDTGNLKVSIATGSAATTFYRVRFGIGTFPDIFAPDRDPATDLRSCFSAFRRLNANSSYESYGTGYATSTTNFRAFIELYPPLFSTPTSVNSSGSVEIAFGSASAADVSAVAFATGGAGRRRVSLDCTVASGLTAGNAGQLRSKNNISSYVDIDTGY